jgi:hypothetical protein
MRSKWSARLCLLAIMIGAAMLRLQWMHESLRHDETFEMLEDLTWNTHQLLFDFSMPLYHLLLHVWSLLGTSEPVFRGLSYLCGVLVLPVVYLLGQRLLGTPQALIATGLVGVNTLCIFYAQEARGYALMILLSAVSTLAFIIAVEGRNNARQWAWYGVFSILMVLSHLLTILVLAAHFLAFCLRRDKLWTAFLQAFLPVAVAAVVSVGIWLHFSLPGADWIQPLTLQQAHDAIVSIVGGQQVERLILVALLLAVGSVWIKPLAAPNIHYQGWNLAVLVLWLLVPPLGLAAVSIVKPLFCVRYVMECAIPASLLLAAACSRLPMALCWPLAIGACCFSLVTFERGGLRPLPADYRESSLYMLCHAQPGDSACFAPTFVFNCFNIYQSFCDHYWSRSRTGPDIMPDNLSGPERQLYFSKHRRVWLMVSNDPFWKSYADALQADLSHFYRTSHGHVYSEVRVILYEHPANDKIPLRPQDLRGPAQ